MTEKLLEYFKGDELAAGVWLGKYAQKGEETPDDMHKRMAKEFARVELNYGSKETPLSEELKSKVSEYANKRSYLTEDRIYELFKDFKYIVPQGSIMSQLGASSIGSLSNCFVIGEPEDSYGGIFQKEEEMVQLMKRRGGVGIDISTLRPNGTDVSNAAKSTSGAVSFMNRFSNGTNEVAQNGRRGALMLSIDINHPDVLDFIKIKRDLTKVTGANISVKLNDEFMKAVENDEDYVLRFPYNLDQSLINSYSIENYEYNKLEKINKGYIKRIKAKEYWDEIIKSAHGSAEPGIIFGDNHHNYSPDGVYPQFKGVTTNPCGEIFMQPYDACRLIAVNLLSFVNNPFTSDAEFDTKKFYEVNYEAMRLSDDLIDLELKHIDRILEKIQNDKESQEVKEREYRLWQKVRTTALSSRRTGLGFTALGDCLAALGYKYDSEEALLFTEQFMHIKMESELDCTIDLAILRGTFEGWDNKTEFIQHSKGIEGGNLFYNFLLDNFPTQAAKMITYGRRNVSFNTVAPTGTVSLLTQTTSGLEPIFQPFYIRRKKVNKGERVDFVDELGVEWMEFPVLHKQFKNWMETNPNGYQVKDEGELNQKQLQFMFEKSPWYGSTANDIDWKKRVEIQGIIQKYITHSISSTINLPSDVTEEEVSEIYLHSWKMGLKGVTVYRDGSRSGVLVTDTNKDNTKFDYKDAPKRPKSLPCEVHTTISKGVKWNVIIGMLDNKPYEVFAVPYFTNEENLELVKIKQGRYDLLKDKETYSEDVTSEMNNEEEIITRLISTSLRHGADIKFIVEQLNKSHGDITSFSKAIARVIKKYIPDGTKSTVTCQDCGSDQVIFQEGCQSCQSCGSSKCG